MAALEGHTISQSLVSEHLAGSAFRVPNLRTVRAIVAGCKKHAMETNRSSYEQLEHEGRFGDDYWNRLRGEGTDHADWPAWPRVRDVDARSAGVKLAAALPNTSSPIALWLSRRAPRSGMPAYVVRDHDSELRARLQKALDRGRGSVILKGRSCSGKSRSAWEAVTKLAGDRLFIDMRDPDEVDAVLRSKPGGHRLLLWLDNLRAGGDAAALIAPALRLLQDRRRDLDVVAMTTMWSAPAVRDIDDPTVRRDLLAMKDLEACSDACVIVDEAWSPPEFDRGWELADEDGLLAVALSEPVVSPPQTLAGSQWTINLWKAPAVRETQAVLTAAIDLAQFGFGVDPAMPLTKALLDVAARAYRGARPSTEDWFELALAEACTPLEDAVWALYPPEPASGIHGSYVVFDPLLQYGKLIRSFEPLPAPLWQLFLDAGLTREGLLRLAGSARRRMLYAQADALEAAARRTPVAPPACPAPAQLARRRPSPLVPARPLGKPRQRERIVLDLTSPERSRADLLLE